MEATATLTRNEAPGYVLSDHAVEQMAKRGITHRAVEAAVNYGRRIYTRGAMVFAIGRKEVSQFGMFGVNLRQFEGVQVVCSPQGNTIFTVYRNRDFRGLRR